MKNTLDVFKIIFIFFFLRTELQAGYIEEIAISNFQRHLVFI